MKKFKQQQCEISFYLSAFTGGFVEGTSVEHLCKAVVGGCLFRSDKKPAHSELDHGICLTPKCHARVGSTLHPGCKWWQMKVYVVYVGIPEPKIYENLILVENLPAIFGAWGVDPTQREFYRTLCFFLPGFTQHWSTLNLEQILVGILISPWDGLF